MSPPLDDHQLDDALRALPRTPVSARFTADVLDRLDDRRRHAGGLLGWSWRQQLAAAAILLIAATGLGLLRLRAAAPTAAAAREATLAALRDEHRALRRELAELEQLEAVARGRLYLGSTDDVDLVLDLGRLARQRQISTRPAAYVPGAMPRPRNPSRNGGSRR